MYAVPDLTYSPDNPFDFSVITRSAIEGSRHVGSADRPNTAVYRLMNKLGSKVRGCCEDMGSRFFGVALQLYFRVATLRIIREEGRRDLRRT